MRLHEKARLLVKRWRGTPTVGEVHAFISYSHKSDKDLAKSLERVLWTFGRKWYALRGVRTYRDDTNLAAEPDFWPAIEQAVRQSRCLVLMASPESAGSTWVAREIAAAIDEHGIEGLCIVQTAGLLPWTDGIGGAALKGNPEAAISQDAWSLFSDAGATPLVVDLRAHRGQSDRLRRRDSDYLSRAASIAAKVLGRDKEAVWGDHYRAQKLRAAALFLSVCVLLTLVVGLMWVASIATSRARTALSRQLAAEALEEERSDRTRASLLLATASLRTEDTAEARRSLVNTLNRQPRLAGVLPSLGTVARNLKFSRASNVIGAELSATDVAVWDVEHKRVIDTIRMPQGYTKPIDGLDFDESGRVLFIRLFQAATDGAHTYQAFAWQFGSPASRLKRIGKSDQLMATYSSGRNIVVLVEGDGEIGFWDLTRGVSVGSRQLPIRFVPAGASFSSDGQRIALWSSTIRNTVALCSIAPPTPSCHTVSIDSNSTLVSNAILRFDGSLLLRLADGRMGYWNAGRDSATVDLLVSSDSSAVDCISFLNDGTFIAAHASGRILRWDLRAGRDPVELGNVVRGSRPIQCGDGSELIQTPQIDEAGHQPRSVLWRVTDAGSGLELVAQLDAPGARVDLNSRWAMSYGTATPALFEMSGSKRAELIPTGQAVFSPDGEWLAVGKLSGDIVILNLGERTTLGVEYLDCGHPSLVSSNAVMSPDGETVACSVGDGSIAAFDSTTGRLLWSVRPPLYVGQPLLAFSPDGRRLAAAGSALVILDAKSGAQIGDGIIEGVAWPKRVTFSVDGRSLVLRSYSSNPDGDDRANVALIDLDASPPSIKTQDSSLPMRGEINGTGLMLQVPRLPSLLVNTQFTPEFPSVQLGVPISAPVNVELSLATSSAAFHPYESIVAAGLRSGAIEFKAGTDNAEARSIIRPPMPGSANVTSLAFAGTGDRLAASYSLYDNQQAFAVVWDVARARQDLPLVDLGRAQGPKVAISNDGRTLLTVAGAIRTWRIDPTAWILEACELLGVTQPETDDWRRLQDSGAEDPCAPKSRWRGLGTLLGGRLF